MGWSFNCVDYGRDAFIANITSQKHFSEGYTPLAHRIVGNNVWQAVRKPDGKVFITLDLIAKERNGGWGYKGISEDMGPCQKDCPLSLLAMCDEPSNEWAANWREKVRQFHAAKAKAKSVTLAPLMCVTFGGKEYTLLEPMVSRRRQWRVKAHDGVQYRMPESQIRKCLAGA